MPRTAPNAAFTVGRAFPGEGPETNPYPRNDVTRRNVRVRREPHVTDRDRRDVGLDIDPPMAPLRLGGPYRPTPDSAQARAGTGPIAGGIHPPTGCSCGKH
jgi:hypothetical protein